MELQRGQPDFEREQIAVFAISYDAVDVLRAFTDKHGITYPLLSDEGSAVIRRLGLLNHHLAEQQAAYGVEVRPQQHGVPYPGSFLLDEQGIVVQKRFAQSYRERETATGILEQGFGRRASPHGPEAHGGSEGVQVRATLDSGTYRYFQRLWLTVELSIAPGLHIYGCPVPEGYTPLSVEIAAPDGLTTAEPKWPAPHPFRVAGLDEQFHVYDGAVRLPLPLTFARRDMGDVTVRAIIRYQACSATDCLMPAELTLDLPVQAAALAS